MRRLSLFVVLLTCAFAAAGPGVGAAGAATALDINVLSNRADLVSGGDALVQIDAARRGRRQRAEGRRRRARRHDAFASRPNGRFLALLDGLQQRRQRRHAPVAGGAGRG